jgi:excisionase family DNA binding protein
MNGKDLWTVGDTAEYWRVHKETILRWIREGQMEAFNIGTADHPAYRMTEEMATTPPKRF